MTDEALAFLLVLGAGSSTAIGSAVVYKSDWIKVASKEVLGISLGLSAGVMLYVSFVEILQKSVVAFEESGYESKFAYLYGTMCFFGGVVMIRLIDKLVHWLSDEESRLSERLDIDKVGQRLKDELPSLQEGNEDSSGGDSGLEMGEGLDGSSINALITSQEQEDRGVRGRGKRGEEKVS